MGESQWRHVPHYELSSISSALHSEQPVQSRALKRVETTRSSPPSLIGKLKMLQSLAGNSCVRLIQSNKSAWYFLFLVLGYILYLIFGAVVFSSVELPHEDILRQKLRGIKRQFLQEHECLSEERLERFLSKALEASNYGVSILNNASASWNWDFTSSLFFASTVLSTTGESLNKAEMS